MGWWQSLLAACCAVLSCVHVEALVLRAAPPQGENNQTELALVRSVRTRHGMRFGVPEQIEEWKDNGKSVACAIAPDKVAALAQSVTAAAYSTQLHQIVDPQASRFIANDGNGNAAKVVEKVMKDAGLETQFQKLDATSMQEFLTAQSTQALGGNVIGFLKGTDLANEVVIVACHYDSVNWE